MTHEPSIRFEIQAQAGEARAGRLITRRGVIETPVFMPVGTAGTVKGIRFEELESADLDARIILEDRSGLAGAFRTALSGTTRFDLRPAG